MAARPSSKATSASSRSTKPAASVSAISAAVAAPSSTSSSDSPYSPHPSSSHVAVSSQSPALTPEEIKRQRGLEAQRAFRARKAAHLQELENRVAALELENTRLKVENDRLKEDNTWLKKEFEKLSEAPKEQVYPSNITSTNELSPDRPSKSPPVYAPKATNVESTDHRHSTLSSNPPLHSPRYHPYASSASPHTQSQHPYGGPALPRILPRHAPSLPSMSDAVLVDLRTTDLSRLAYSSRRRTSTVDPDMRDLLSSRPPPPSLDRQVPARGNSLPMPKPVYPGSIETSPDLRSSVHVLSQDVTMQPVHTNTSPTSSNGSTATVKPASISSDASANVKARSVPQRAPSLPQPLPPMSTITASIPNLPPFREHPRQLQNAHNTRQNDAPYSNAPPLHQTPSASTLNPLVLSPGRECDSPPSLQANLPLADVQSYRDARRMESLDTVSSVALSSSTDDYASRGSRSSVGETPSLSNSIDTRASWSSFSSTSNSNSGSQRFRKPKRQQSSLNYSTFELDDDQNQARSAPLPENTHHLQEQQQAKLQELNEASRDPPKQRATIDDLYDLFGERPELSEPTDQAGPMKTE